MIPPQARFQVLQETFGTSPAYRLIDTGTGEHAVILPFNGGALNSLAVRSQNEIVEILDGYTSLDDLKEHRDRSFKGANLFPFPNRVSGGSYRFNSQRYQLAINFPQEENAIHGLVFNKKFKVLQRADGAQECYLTLGYDSATGEQGYPFSYSLEHDYCLGAEHGFSCTTRITNDSDVTIPVGHGWHPYFTAGGETIDNLRLSFSATGLLEVDGGNIPTGKTSAHTGFAGPEQVADTALDYCFRLDSSVGRAEAVLSNPRNKLSLSIWQETGDGKYNFIQIYTPPTRRAIALEPMTCAPDAFNNGDGLILLPAGKSISLSWGVSCLT